MSENNFYQEKLIRSIVWGPNSPIFSVRYFYRVLASLATEGSTSPPLHPLVISTFS